jgi:hypothetical protein
MNEVTNPIGTVTVYCCGGGGINIGSMLENCRAKADPGFATISNVYIDTSVSNLLKRGQDIKEEHRYILDDLDGSGKIRRANVNQIVPHVKSILQQHKPGDFNIVVSTGGGGSGSVFAPLLVQQLLLDGQTVVVLTIGSLDTKNDITNTLNTLLSYEASGKKAGTSVVMAYFQNDENNSREKNDQAATKLLTSLFLLFSKQNHELDSRDLFNWSRPEDVTGFPAQLLYLSVADSKEEVKQVTGNIVSVATLATVGTNVTLSPVPPVQYVGYLDDEVAKNSVPGAMMNFVISDGVIPATVAKLKSLKADIEKSENAQIRSTGILKAGDADENDLVL